VAIEHRATLPEPAVAQIRQGATTELRPTEMAQGPALIVFAMARNERSIEIGGPQTITAEAAALALSAFEAVVHVPKHHQRNRPMAPDPVEGQGQILITPIHGGTLPIPATGIRRVTAQASGSAMGQHHQGQGWVGL